MKVGTDGVLLGAWCPIINHKSQITNTPFRVLDVGTGSGLIALMLAQRCPNAQIEAIDIDPNAVEQAKENVQISNFKSQISNFVSRLQDWRPENKYDIVVSNPPYFRNSLKNPDEGRKTARHTDSLSYEELITHSVRLLNPDGLLALILPAEEEQNVCALAVAAGLSLTRLTRVYSKESKPARRVLLAFCKSQMANNLSPITNNLSPIVSDALVLEDEKGGRSAAYSKLCEEFYL